jgi:hypothetical protein
MIDPSLPWIIIAIASSFFGLKINVLIGLALQIAFFIPMARKRTYSILDAYSLVFFVILVIGSLVLGERRIENLTRWSAALSYGGLAFIAWATIAIGDPFTDSMPRGLSRRSVRLANYFSHPLCP